MNIEKTLPPIWRYWLPVWIVFFLALNLIDLTSLVPDLLTVIKLSSIILCFIYALQAFPEDHLLHVAMFTTCIADLILAARNTSEAGIIVFFITQIIHLVRLDGERLKLPITIYATFATIIIFLDLIFPMIPLIFVVSTFYGLTLIANICISFGWWRTSPGNHLALCAFLGFLLFGCCDLCTVVSYLSLTEVIPFVNFYAVANFAAWFFYYPSQVLVSNSSRLTSSGASILQH